jgi:membrane protease YdiL (CAAX protease family)
MVEEYNKTDVTSMKTSALPRPQAYLLLTILIGYPALSLIMDMLGSTDPSKITSRIVQVYFPSLVIQILILSVIWLILRRTGDGFADIGLGKHDFSWSNALSGMIFFLGAWTVIFVLRLGIERTGYLPEKNILYLLPVTLKEKGFWIVLSIGAAFSEEICFRGFVISRLREVSGSYWVGAVLSSAAFCMGHLYQGIAGVALTFIYGMLFSGLFVARKSVFPCIVAHFLQDALILLAFWRA